MPIHDKGAQPYRCQDDEGVRRMTAPRLISPETWASRYFPGECDRPDLRTVRKWIANGEIPGRTIGRRFFVDEAAWLGQRHEPPAKQRPVSAYRL